MGGDEIRYNFGVIEGARADIASTTAAIEDQLFQLKKFIEPLAATWGGTAAAAYQREQANWDRSAADLKAVLDAIGRAVGSGNEEMQETNNRAAASWG